jgi:hypothetical protein
MGGVPSYPSEPTKACLLHGKDGTLIATGPLADNNVYPVQFIDYTGRHPDVPAADPASCPQHSASMSSLQVLRALQVCVSEIRTSSVSSQEYARLLAAQDAHVALARPQLRPQCGSVYVHISCLT